MPLQAPYYPIVFIRGFAMRDSDIIDAANSVYQGFEASSTRQRRDSGPVRSPIFFESPVLRLMKDHGYDDSFRDNSYGYQSPARAQARSLWVHRYYDQDEPAFGDGQLHPMEAYALGLRRTILNIRDKMVADGTTTEEDFKVHLVAHSMGGLVARCYLQNICARPPVVVQDPRLELPTAGPVNSYVSRFFTYATPHNGIEVLGGNVPNFGPTAFNQIGVFNRTEMARFLRLPPGEAVNDIEPALDPDQVFCLIGTDYPDYDIDVSKWATGGPGDGLVLCKNAYTLGSPRAFVRRAHGGPYGIVNSEEGYQNLRRFLFGDWRVDVQVTFDEVDVPDPVAAQIAGGDTVTGNFRTDVIVSVRGEEVMLHERRDVTESAITFTQVYKAAVNNSPVPVINAADADLSSKVASIYLMSQAISDPVDPDSTAMVFALSLAIDAPSFKSDRFLFPPTFAGFKVLQETFQIAIDPVAGEVRYAIASVDGQVPPNRPLSEVVGNLAGGTFAGEIPFGPAPPLKSGQARGHITISVTPN